MDTENSFPGIKRQGHEVDHPYPPSCAEVKNGGAIPPLLRMSSWRSDYLIKQRDNFTFTFVLVKRRLIRRKTQTVENLN
jgi:hypothetical protein